MCAFQTKSSVLAVVQETTEGTPVAPTGATQYTALQDGFEISPDLDQIENAELTGSIGKAATILGFESPKASFDHYIRHSGTEGTAPDYSLLLEMAFGTKVTAGTQYTTSASSTAGTSSVRAVLKSTGNSANFQRGQAVLIKDGTNGYSIRNVYAITDADTIQLAQNLSAAPASGIGLGKAVLYKPADSGHKTASLWVYRANGADVEMISGSRVTELGINATSGDLLKGSLSLEGVQFYFDPIEITASTKYLDFLDDAATRAAVVTAKIYKDPVELADAIASAMNGLGSANTFTCTYSSSSGKFTVTSTGTTLTLKWNTGTNTANSIAAKVGFSTAADSSGALTYTSASALTLTSPYTPTFDSSNPLVVKDNEVLFGDFGDTGCFGVQSIDFKLTDAKTDVLDICAVSGKSGSVITQREATVDLVATLSRYEADKYARFRQGSNIQFAYNFGVKSGGNWVAGKCGNLFIPTATITSFKVTDTDGLVTLELSLAAYVSSSLGEVYLNFV